MQTYSHIILATVMDHFAQSHSAIPIHSKAFLMGSFAPDVALGLLTTSFLVDRRLKKEAAVWCGDEFNSNYFNDPLWIVTHNLLHAPFIVVMMIIVGYYMGTRYNKNWGCSLFWFSIGCGIHSMIDIGTHHNDGPLLLFPFNWQKRFSSPISYWDRKHGAALFSPLEHLLDFMLIVNLFREIVKDRCLLSKETSNMAHSL